MPGSMIPIPQGSQVLRNPVVWWVKWMLNGQTGEDSRNVTLKYLETGLHNKKCGKGCYFKGLGPVINDVNRKDDDGRWRQVSHLLKANHNAHALILDKLDNDEFRFNDCSRYLVAAYLLGVPKEELRNLYDAESENLKEWEDSPGEVTDSDWKKYLGDKNYQRAYFYFFEDKYVEYGYNWKEMINDYLFNGESWELFAGLFGGHMAPLIHLAYAFEMNSSILALEALAMGSSCFEEWQVEFLKITLVDEKSDVGKSNDTKTKNLLDILVGDARTTMIRENAKFLGLSSMKQILEKYSREILGWWCQWDLTPEDANNDSKKLLNRLKEIQKVAAIILTCTPCSEGEGTYDGLIAQAVIASHAVRVMLPLLPCRMQLVLLRMLWLLMIYVYVSELCPGIDLKKFMSLDMAKKGWDIIQCSGQDSCKLAQTNRDAQYMQTLRALKGAADTWRSLDTTDHQEIDYTSQPSPTSPSEASSPPITDDEFFRRVAFLFVQNFRRWSAKTIPPPSFT